MLLNVFFRFDTRLGIPLPNLTAEWAHYSRPEREAMVGEWEHIRGIIPDRIKAFEAIINEKQALLQAEEDFLVCCRLNSEVADYASRINDLHLWFRLNQDVAVEKIHA